MVSHRLQDNKAAAMAVIAFLASVMAQSNNTNCAAGCLHPTGKNSCHPINHTFLYSCLSKETYQYSPALTVDHLSLTCIAGIGWFNAKGIKPYEIKCVKRKKHCLTPPAANRSNVIIQIHGQTINVGKKSESLYYLEGTTAIYYTSKTSKPKASDYSQQQYWRCTKKRTGNETSYYYAWEMITQPLFNLPLAAVSAVDHDDGDSSNSDVGISLHPKFDDVSDIDRHLLRNSLLGICSFLGVVLIGVLVFLLHRYRIYTGQGRHSETINE